MAERDAALEGAEPQSVVAARVANRSALRAATRPRRSLLFVRKEAASSVQPAPAKPAEGPAKASSQLAEQETTAGTVGWATPGRILTPYHDLASLYELPEYSSELSQNIDAMVTNIAGLGWKLKCRLSDVELKELNTEDRRAVKAQYVRAWNLLNTGIIGAATGGHSARMTFRQLKKRTRTSVERTANGFWEFIPDALQKAKDGALVFNEYGTPVRGRSGIRYLSALHMWATERDRKPVVAEMPVVKMEMPEDVDASPRRVLALEPIEVHFRRYVQRIGGEEVWFKELGDPRPVCKKTGRVLSPQEAQQPGVCLANEIWHWCIASDGTVYGRVRWMGNLLTVQGDRSAEEVNFDTLENDAIPAMLYLVSGTNVKMADATMDALEDFERGENRNRARGLVIEAEPADANNQSSEAKLEAKPLVDAQMHDAMFVNYQKNNADKIRSSFRHSPVRIGREMLAGQKAVDAARRLDDEQVYQPEREDEDETTSDIILPFFGITYWCVETEGPSVTDDQDVVNVMKTLEQTGGMTPRLSRKLGGEVLHQDLGHDAMEKTEDFDPDKPNNLQMANALAHQRSNNVNLGTGSNQVTVRKEVDDLRDDLARFREELEEALTALRAAKGQ
jgi:capsid portal protein